MAEQHWILAISATQEIQEFGRKPIRKASKKSFKEQMVLRFLAKGMSAEIQRLAKDPPD